MRRHVRGLVVLVAPMLIAACGSTVEATGQGTGSDGLGPPGSSLGRASIATGPAGQTLAGPNGGLGSATGAGTTSAGVIGSQTSGGSVAGGAASIPTKALPQKTVTVGAWVAGQGYDTVAANLGIKGLALGNQTNQVRAMVKEINAHGGLLGAKIVLVLHVTQTTTTNSQSQEAQAICADFTEDHHVQFAISVLGDPTGLLAKCLAARGVPFIDDDDPVDSGFASTLSHHLFLPSDWLLDRVMRTQVDALNGIGFFKGPGKVGILLYDTPVSTKVLQRVVIPRLAAIGVKSPDSYALKADGSDYEAESNVVVKFRADGVTRIITIACSPLGFMINAESQHFYPRYGVYSTMGPGALLETAAPADQLKGSVGFGWSPPYDVDASHQPAPVSSNQTRCWTVMKNAGEDTSGTAGALQLWFCDAFWFLQKALATSGDVSATGLATGARSMRGYLSPVTWRTDLSSGRPDGVSAYRDLAYETSCSCYVYTSGLKPASN